MSVLRAQLLDLAATFVASVIAAVGLVPVADLATLHNSAPPHDVCQLSDGERSAHRSRSPLLEERGRARPDRCSSSDRGLVPIPRRSDVMNAFFGPPPTPEQIAELEKRQLAKLSDRERKYKAMLPCLLEARRSLRDAASFGCAGPDFEVARRNVAVIIDDIETELVRPVT